MIYETIEEFPHSTMFKLLTYSTLTLDDFQHWLMDFSLIFSTWLLQKTHSAEQTTEKLSNKENIWGRNVLMSELLSAFHSISAAASSFIAKIPENTYSVDFNVKSSFLFYFSSIRSWGERKIHAESLQSEFILILRFSRVFRLSLFLSSFLNFSRWCFYWQSWVCLGFLREKVP